MSPFILPEAAGDPAADLALFVLLQINNTDHINHLSGMLTKIKPPLTVHIDKEKSQALLVSEASVEADTLLGRIVAALADNNGESGSFEIIECRLLATQAVSFSNELNLSRFIKVRICTEPDRHIAPDELMLMAENVFGTGLHPSTRLAAQAIDDLCEAQGLSGTVLDIGCGSGILALIAARLGAAKVVGIDVSMKAAQIAGSNAANNNLQAISDFTTTPAADITGSFDLVVANITAAVMTDLFTDICRLVRPGGKLIISGLQGRQGGEMAEEFIEAGFVMNREYREGKWVGWQGRRGI